MDGKNMQRISLYLNKDIVKTADLFIKQHGYRSRNDFFTDAVKTMVADSVLGSENEIVSEKLARAVKNLSEDNAKAISKGLFRYAVQLEMICQILAYDKGFDADFLEDIRHEAINNVRRTRGHINFEEILNGYYQN